MADSHGGVHDARRHALGRHRALSPESDPAARKPLSRPARSPGYTFSELALILALILILVAIGVPKFADLIQKANEASTVGKLTSMRGALAVYYTDNDGSYPNDLSPLLTPGSKYLTGIIPMYTRQHGSSELISYYSTGSTPTDTGGWGYVNNKAQPQWGNVFVDCTHTDLKGYYWTTY